MAKTLGLTRDKLASLEYGRTVLRYGFAARFCRELDCNQRWLATGKEPVQGWVELPQDLASVAQLTESLPFSQVYDKLLHNFVDEQTPRIFSAQVVQLVARIRQQQQMGTLKALETLIPAWFEGIPRVAHGDFISELDAAARKIAATFTTARRGSKRPS